MTVVMESAISSSSELFDQARDLMDEGNVETAIELFQSSLDLYPHFKTLELLGECFVSLNRLRESIVPLAAASTLNDGVRAPSILANVFLKLGDRDAARSIAAIALSRDPDNRKAKAVMSAVAEVAEQRI